MITFDAYAGIDVSKNSFAAALNRGAKEMAVRQGEFENSPAGFAEFEEWISSHIDVKSQLLICIECTGVYSESLSHFLYSQDYIVWLESPAKVRRAFKVHYHKTDLLDAKQIAEYAFRFEDKFRQWQPKSVAFEHLSTLITAREQLVKQRTATINALKMISRKVLQIETAIKLYKENIETLNKQILELENEVNNIIAKNAHFRQTTANIASISGIGPLIAANLLLVTEGGSQLTDYPKLAAFIGICPYQKESGSSIYRRPTSAADGPSRLRKLLFLASLSSVRRGQLFNGYFQRKVAQGKPKKLILNNVANKMLRLACAIMKQGKPFDRNYRSINPNFIN